MSKKLINTPSFKENISGLPNVPSSGAKRPEVSRGKGGGMTAGATGGNDMGKVRVKPKVSSAPIRATTPRKFPPKAPVFPSKGNPIGGVKRKTPFKD